METVRLARAIYPDEMILVMYRTDCRVSAGNTRFYVFHAATVPTTTESLLDIERLLDRIMFLGVILDLLLAPLPDTTLYKTSTSPTEIFSCIDYHRLLCLVFFFPPLSIEIIVFAKGNSGTFVIAAVINFLAIFISRREINKLKKKHTHNGRVKMREGKPMARFFFAKTLRNVRYMKIVQLKINCDERIEICGTKLFEYEDEEQSAEKEWKKKSNGVKTRKKKAWAYVWTHISRLPITLDRFPESSQKHATSFANRTFRQLFFFSFSINDIFLFFLLLISGWNLLQSHQRRVPEKFDDVQRHVFATWIRLLISLIFLPHQFSVSSP